ncbi:BZ3500_MvSof-1268-A1-R1_Chr8-1g09986 [Microbotryum saponariae]|uniref:BZ3500_MvSof-1268-A1-R1_Chr8-1g09986 protein n=1 Tax=Microbotryum saponariae TaxID=289078 RepID=A0A2X0NJU3_9BASI|nr:BZ3500_MvSof-1268-A1-R1_Chr8-1g09986 [Microbotryum saponariae]SDA08272.1 BZ3501_MvSof-1269-A2-R1_Chr8-1g09709 [Microbotryum saponariae]
MASLSSNVVLSLPDEAIRNQMIDVYFHQIVHPTLPILDKAQFFSWSAYLPPTDAATSIAAQALPAELYLSVFAVVAPYLHSDSTHSSETFAAAARFYLYSSMKDPSVETVQACTLLAIADWGLNELSRAWILSSLSIALSITLGMHRRQQHDSLTPSPSRLRTFHAAIIVHTLLSLRLSRPPIINCEDYDVPLPPSEGSENFELWSLGHNANHLRGEYALEPIATIARRPGAVRSSTLLLFSKTASLCTLGLAVLRWSLRPAAGGDHGEADRQNLIKALVAWERGLPPELMIGEPSTRGTDRVKERSRSIIEMHMTLHSLYARLSPSQEAVAEGGRAFSYDPAPESISMLLQLTTTTRDLFTYLRTMPLVEMALDVLVKAGLGEEPSVSGAYEELGRVHRLVRREGAVSRFSAPNMATPLSTEGGYDSPIDAFVQMHPTSQVDRPPHPLTSSLHGTTQPAKDSPHASLAHAEALSVSTEPFQAFLSYSDVLGPSATASTVLDFGSWDQSDLLVSLGLVSDPTAGSQAWQPPPSSDMSSSHHVQHLPVLDASKPISLQPLATAGATEFPHSGLNDAEVGPGNSHTSIGYATPLGGEENNAAFMFDHFGQGTDLLARWLDRGSWATGSSGEPIQGLSTGDSEQDLPSNTGMMLDPSSGEGMMM